LNFFRPYISIKIVTTLLIGCCASTYGCNLVFHKENISQITSDTYKISKHGADSLEMRKLAWQEANDFCQKMDLYFMPVAKNYNKNDYEMEFRCLSSGDPELLEGETPYQAKRYQKKLGGYGQVDY
jgi:hypothetical protein